MKLIAPIALASTLAVVAPPVLAQADVTTLGFGLDYTTGNYGRSQSTDILYLPFSAKYETGRWAYKLVVPYIRITGPGNVVGAPGDSVVLPGGTAARRTESGLGDVVASAFYNVLNERNAPFGLDVGGKLKLGTADENRGLGTGKDDFSLQADFFKPIGALTPFASVGYRWYGDPAGVNLKNVVYESAGVSYRMSQATTLGFAYDHRPRIVDGGGAVSEATAFVSQRLGGGWKLQVYGVTGFQDGSPDWGAGAVMFYSF